MSKKKEKEAAEARGFVACKAYHGKWQEGEPFELGPVSIALIADVLIYAMSKGASLPQMQQIITAAGNRVQELC